MLFTIILTSVVLLLLNTNYSWGLYQKNGSMINCLRWFIRWFISSKNIFGLFTPWCKFAALRKCRNFNNITQICIPILNCTIVTNLNTFKHSNLCHPPQPTGYWIMIKLVWRLTSIDLDIHYTTLPTSSLVLEEKLCA